MSALRRGAARTKLLLPLALLTAAGSAFGQAPVTINTAATLPTGYSQIPYSLQFSATTNPSQAMVTWSVVPAMGTGLPSGLALDAVGGFLHGTPDVSTAGMTYSFTVMAMTAYGQATRDFTLAIATPQVLISSPTSLLAGLAGTAYSTALTATVTPASATLAWSNSGQLPPGLSLNAVTGVISGTPTLAGTYNFSVTAQIPQTTVSNTQMFTLTVYIGKVNITTTTLPLAPAGQPYSTTLTATPDGVTWKLGSTLPQGLNFDTATGKISGTPSGSPGAYGVLVQAMFTNYLSATQTFTLYVTNGPLSILQTSIPIAIQSTPYQTTLTPVGGLAPYSWSFSGNTFGLSIGAASGMISGTPTALGAQFLTVVLTDVTGTHFARSFSLFVATQLSILTTSLPNGTYGVAYSQTLQAGGGQPPYHWAIASGSGPLPPGLSLDPNTGLISGTPDQEGTASFTVQLTDDGQRVVTKTLSITIGASSGVTITTGSLADGLVGVAYTQTLAATGGIPPYSWAVTNGALPPGLTLGPSTGTISGTPTTAGTVTLTIQVTDSTPATVPLKGEKAFTLKISAALTVTTSSLPDGAVGAAYSQTLTASGGQPPYTWSIGSGSLPAGLQLDASAGTISGKPTSAGTTLFVIVATDSGGQSAQKSLGLKVTGAGAPPSITTGNLSATAGTAFSQVLTATGGTPPYTFALTGGTLPAGLSFNPATGALAGTPTAAATADLTFTVTDSNQQTASKVITITVSLPSAPTVTFGDIPAIPAKQPAVTLSLSDPYPVDLSGTLSLTFQSSVGGDDQTVQFITSAGGSRTVSFTVPAGQTSAVIPGGAVLATGTVAGTITITATLAPAGSGNVVATQTETVVIPPSAPVIQSVNLSNSGALMVTVVGYSTTRDMTSGVFHFAASSGNTLAQSDITVPLASAFTTWYQNSASNAFGSQFKLTVPFTVSGSASSVVSVTVTLTNSKGISAAVSPQ